MQSIASLVLLLASVVAAVPVNTVPTSPLLDGRACVTTPSLPVNGGGSELANPSGTLAYVALGRGIQNYTCSAAGATPVAIGAVATLYDATELAKCSTAAFNNLPATAVYSKLPSSSNANFLGLKTLGKHFFDVSGTPTFDLSTVSKILHAGKTGDIAAPSGANKGPAGTGAVDWLALSAKASYTSVGLKEVYRVETAGGNPVKPCTKAGVESIQYAAQYWFYN